MCYSEYECINQRRWASDRYVWAWETTYQRWAQDIAAVWVASVEAAGSLQAAQISEGAQTVGLAVVCSGVPGCGEMSDIGVLLDPEAGLWEKLLAGTSLGANALCASCPNAGPFILASKTLGRAGAGAARGTLRGGAPAGGISAADARRIQNAANRIGKPIDVVGSRARGPVGSSADYDYVIDANARVRNSITRSLPGAGNVREGVRPNIDVFKGPVDPGRPSIRFEPEVP